MKSKAEIVRDWLPRYTGRSLDEFGQFILLSNFIKYVELFAERFKVEVVGRDHPMQSATAENLTILNFGMGSAMAATVMDLLAAVEPKAVLFLGKCGGLKKTKVGDFILPIAAIRGEGASNDYMPSEIPALPSFRLQRAVSTMIVKHGFDYWTGTVYTTNRRVWEHDQQFKEYLQEDPRLGHRHGDRDDLHRRFRQPHSQRRAASRLGQPDDPRRRQNQSKRQVGDGPIRPQAPGDRHRLADRAA